MSMTTSENDEEQTEEQPPTFEAGARVDDLQEGAKHLRVAARTPHVASKSRIAAIGETVYDVNAAEYPECADDAVYICVYESTLDERFGAQWRHWDGSYLAFMTGNYGLQTYSFPQSRLAEAEQRPQEKWTEAEQEGDDGE